MNSTLGGNEAPPCNSPVVSALAGLEYELDTLVSMLDKLESRLSPALVPFMSPANSTNDNAKLAQPQACDLVLNLQAKRSQAVHMQDTIQSILNRIEL